MKEGEFALHDQLPDLALVRICQFNIEIKAAGNRNALLHRFTTIAHIAV